MIKLSPLIFSESKCKSRYRTSSKSCVRTKTYPLKQYIFSSCKLDTEVRRFVSTTNCKVLSFCDSKYKSKNHHKV